MSRNRILRRAIALSALLLLLISATFTLPVSAADNDVPEISGCEALVLYDKTHEKYIIEENGNIPLNTSTSAKITMGLIACEMLQNRLEETVTVTEEMISNVTGSKIQLSVGEEITVRDLLYHAICGSYNDAAYVIAHVCAGGTQEFVDLMNVRARELGAKDTTYHNPIGYPDSEGMVTTAYDVLKIALAASENKLYMDICSAVSYDTEPTSVTPSLHKYNRNHLISSSQYTQYHNSYCLGMNAGYSGRAGGWSIVTLVRDKETVGGNVDYICVLLGGKESDDGSAIYAFEDVNRVANWVRKKYSNLTLFNAGKEMGSTKIGLTIGGEKKFELSEDLVISVPKDSASVSYDIVLNENLRAPLRKGDVIGSVVATLNGEKVGEAPIVISEDCEVNGVMRAVDYIGSYTKSRAFIATIVFFVVSVIIALVYKYFIRYNYKGRYVRRR